MLSLPIKHNRWGKTPSKVNVYVEEADISNIRELK